MMKTLRTTAFLCLTILSVSFLGVSRTRAQAIPDAGTTPHRPMVVTMKHYPDSAKFAREFSQMFALIKPKESVTSRVQQKYAQMLPVLKRQGIDSAKGWEAIQGVMDPNFDYEHLFNLYRSIYTADEMATLRKFYQTGAGKKLLASQTRLFAADREMLGYATRIISSTVMPMRQLRKPAVQTDSVASRDGSGATEHIMHPNDGTGSAHESNGMTSPQVRIGNGVTIQIHNVETSAPNPPIDTVKAH